MLSEGKSHVDIVDLVVAYEYMIVVSAFQK
jgi:hypothetical protein